MRAKVEDLIEIISSPLLNLTGVNGIATNVATDRPAEFPHAAADGLAWPRRSVDYFKDGRDSGRFFVQSRAARMGSAYPKTRTREHFMTVSFARRPAGGGVELTADAWLVRERTGREYLPARSFREPVRVILR